LKERLDELKAFQDWMDWASAAPRDPAIVRAQVITQNYVCFVYLRDSCFIELGKRLPTESTAKKCCGFLTADTVRAFRNAIAHANWHYKPDFSGIEYWARAGGGRNASMDRHEVNQQDLAFWQALARCTAYAAFLGM
jgi:hypothetical protein